MRARRAQTRGRPTWGAGTENPGRWQGQARKCSALALAGWGSNPGPPVLQPPRSLPSVRSRCPTPAPAGASDAQDSGAESGEKRAGCYSEPKGFFCREPRAQGEGSSVTPHPASVANSSVHP